jgi:cellulose synthase/poly-beta-1,6-N-acetylglucosamine synthase-like glycosyltransferase
MTLKPKISILAPTRKRPLRLTEMYLSALDNASHPNDIEFIVYVDEDDKSYDQLKLKQMTIIRGERRSISEAWNTCSQNARGAVQGLFADDVVFRTFQWDLVLSDAMQPYPDRIGYFYTSDGTATGEGFGTHGFLHQNWIDAVGYFVPPYFTANQVDRWLDEVSTNIGRHVYTGITTEHMHQGFGKAPLDDTYKEALAREQTDRNESRYRDTKNLRKKDEQKLKAHMANLNSNRRD